MTEEQKNEYASNVSIELGKLLLGADLSVREAVDSAKEFHKRYNGFPLAVCFSLQEITHFLSIANASLPSVNTHRKAIAFVFGINQNRPGTHRYNKPTIMMVGTEFDEDSSDGRVTNIVNQVTEIYAREVPGNPPIPTPAGRITKAYDVGSIYP